jgi:hypothetical protein
MFRWMRDFCLRVSVEFAPLSEEIVDIGTRYAVRRRRPLESADHMLGDGGRPNNVINSVRLNASKAWCSFSVPPEIAELARIQLRITHRRVDRLVAEIVLQAPCVMPGLSERKATRMAQHMRMHREPEPCRHAGAPNQFRHAIARERRAALGDRGKPASRCTRRRARSSSPRIGCVAGLPCLTRRT